ncbi:MAG: hypothetical protein LBV07_00130 [Syntrophobacterales bacterium]|nr:hypothetical protein [Syntrophobacterales bacterium]
MRNDAGEWFTSIKELATQAIKQDNAEEHNTEKEFPAKIIDSGKVEKSPDIRGKKTEAQITRPDKEGRHILYFIGIYIFFLFSCGFYAVWESNAKNEDPKIAIIPETDTITEDRGKIIINLLIILFILPIILACIAAPYEFFDAASGYAPVVSYVIAVLGISFFSCILISSIIRLIKPKIVIQISDDGISVPKGFYKLVFIPWEEVMEINHSRLSVFICLQNRHKYFPQKSSKGTDIRVAIHMAKYSAEEIIEILHKKWQRHSEYRTEEIMEFFIKNGKGTKDIVHN